MKLFLILAISFLQVACTSAQDIFITNELHVAKINQPYSIKILVVSKCDVLTTYLSCLDCILIKIDARQLHDFLSSSKSLKFSV